MAKTHRQPHAALTTNTAADGRSIPRWTIAAAFVLLICLTVPLIVGSHAVDVFQTWTYAALVPPLLVSAGMLGILLMNFLTTDELFSHSPWPDMYRAIVSIALGLGTYSLAMLALGALHLLHPYWLPLIVPLSGAAIGFPAARNFCRTFDWTPLKAPAQSAQWFILLGAVPVAMTLIAATFPPGSLWTTEGNGYDVLEYHLQMPREYALANSILPVPHNVYSYLPANVEMLYLLLTDAARTLMGEVGSLGHLWGVFPSQFLHLALMLLTVAAIGLAPIRLSALGRAVAMLLTLSIPWTIITGSLAYDEWGMMLFGSLALGLAMRPRNGAVTRWADPEGALIGILIGLAVGSKLTAGIAFALPVAFTLLLKKNPKALVTVVLLSTALYLPWAIRAAISSGGNPVFPLAANILGHDGWTPEQVLRFNHGHDALDSQRTLAGRASGLLNASFLDEQWSPGWSSLYLWAGQKPPARTFWWKHLGIAWLVIALALLYVISTHRTNQALTLIIVLAVQILAWMFLTHLQSRFLLPIIVPLAFLMGMAAGGGAATTLRAGLTRVILCTIIGAQSLMTIFLLLPETGLLGGLHPMRIAKSDPPQIGELFARGYNIAVMTAPPSERADTPDAKVLLVGDAMPLFWDGDIQYSTVFDRNLLADALRAGGPDGAAQWLRAQHFDFVVVDWPEINRLRATYGFDSAITRAAIDALIRPGITPEPLDRAFTVLHIHKSEKP